MMADRVEITKMRMEEIFDYYADKDELRDRLILEIQDAYCDGLLDGMSARDKEMRQFIDGKE